MFDLFEMSDSLNRPIECFYYDCSVNEFPVRQHWHYYVEIVFVSEGNCVMNCNDDYYSLQTGDCMFFHPGAIHSVSSENPAGLRYKVFKFDISKMSLTPRYAPKLRSIFKCAEKSGCRIVFRKKETELLGFEPIFDEAISEINSHEYGYDMLIKANIYRLLMKILRIWQNEGFQVDDEAYMLDEAEDIESITEYIDTNISENLKVSELAARCGMSYSYFAKRFQHTYGRSCKEYIETIRLVKVEEYLQFTDFDLTYISQETGFSDCSHLIKCFKASRHMTPAQFRKMKSIS